MAILNYSTKIDANKTIGEIQGKLAKSGAKKIVIDYDDEGLPSGITFACVIASGKMVYFSLPSKWEGVLKAMEKTKVTKSLKNKEQALRVSWRIIKVWIEAQLAIIEAELAELPEVFLPYAVTKDGDTMYELISRDQKILLTE